ncbi:MAG TPA: hypothetical protein EYN69_08460, partial [Flavobacteriales bacterium]|nr:hypothetical protein [Flavobacteriales bacterium]
MRTANQTPTLQIPLLAGLCYLFSLVTGGSYAQTTYETAANGSWSSNSSWQSPGAPPDQLPAGDSVIIRHQITATDDIDISGTYLIDVAGSYSGSKKITLGTTGKLVNNGLINTTDELLNGGSFYNNNYAYFKKIQNDGYECNTDTVELENGEKYDCNGCTLECGGRLIACEIKLQYNGNTSNDALISAADICCDDGSDPTVDLQSGTIAPAVTFCATVIELPYLETFSTSNLGVTGSGWNTNYGSATWTLGDDGANLTASSDYCKSNGTWLRWRDTDGPISWYSPVLDVSSYSYVYISYTISEAGNLENADYISVYYRYDGGSWILASNDKNDFGTLNYGGVLTVSSYSSLELRAQGKTTHGSEYIKLDNVSVLETDYIVPATGNISLTLCSGNIYDNGGLSANYFSSTDGYTVITPSTVNSAIQLDFNLFDVENLYDYLYIYDGNSTSAPQVLGSPFTGSKAPTTVLSTAADGSLTLRFTSDGSGEQGGFDATISCVVTGCAGTPTPGSSSASSYSICSGATVSLSNKGAESGSDITYQWQESANNSIWNNISGATLTSYDVTPSVSTFYRLKVTCTASKLSDYANLISIVAVTTTPTLTLNNPAAVCSPSTVDITDAAVSSTNVGTLAYYTDAGFSNAVSDPTQVGDGTYYVEATNSSCTANGSVVVTVNSAATVSAGVNATICEGSTHATLGVFGGGASSILWTTSGSGTFLDDTDPTTTYTPSAGDITAGSVTLTITSDDPAGACGSESDNMLLTIDAAITMSDAGADQNLCNITTATLAGNSVSGLETGAWSVVSGTASATSVNSPTSG